MSPIDHAAAHERIADLALEPGGIEAALASAAPDNRALAEHVATCERCLADIAAWRTVQRTVGGAMQPPAPGQRADVEPIEAGAGLRSSVLAAAHGEPRRRESGALQIAPLRSSRFAAPRLPSFVLGLAAALVVAIGGTVLLAGPVQTVVGQVGEARALSGVVASLDRILSDSAHRTVALKDGNGQAAGTISWSNHDLVVLTAAIKEPAPGQVYRCWLSGPGGDTAIGKMEFAGGTAYWVGSLDEWASISLAPGTAFYVTRETGPAGTPRSGPVVLEGDL
ncbi:MAG TPA: anti-sigma factor [Candidatus Limnocylindrales bacterium]